MPGILVRQKDLKDNPKEALKQMFVGIHKGIIRQHNMKMFDPTMYAQASGTEGPSPSAPLCK